MPSFLDLLKPKRAAAADGSKSAQLAAKETDRAAAAREAGDKQKSKRCEKAAKIIERHAHTIDTSAAQPPKAH